MKTRVMLILMCCVMVFGVAQAQGDTPKWKLKTPMATEYLAAVPDAIRQYQADLPDDYAGMTSNPLNDAIFTELRRYPDATIFNQNFELLSGVYDAINGDINSGIPYNYSPFSSDWDIALLKAWLREHPVDLSREKTLDLSSYSVRVLQPFDFNKDGVDEYILELQAGDGETLLVLQRDDQAAEHYRIIPTDVWVDQTFPNDGDLASISFQDITGDGLPEWTISSAQSTLPGVWIGCGQFTILTWRDNGFSDIFDGGSYCESNIGGYDPKTVELKYVNVDSDPELEIQLIQNVQDTWNCLQTITTTYDWNGTKYVQGDPQTAAAASANCALREAEALMWKSDTVDAVPLYENALQLQWDSQDAQYDVEEMRQYAEARLVVAYALSGKPDQAQALLQSLKSETPRSEMIGTLVEALATAQPNALSLCTAAYNVYRNYQRSTFSYPSVSTGIMVGRDHNFEAMIEDSPPDPEKAGCDAATRISALLASHTFAQDRSPVDQLKALGIDVADSLHADLNGDGQDEWLVWTVADVPPIFFAPVRYTNIYLLSRPEMRRPNVYTEITTHVLPNRTTAIVDWAYIFADASNTDLAYYDIELHSRGYNCQTADPQKSGQYLGTIQILRLKGHQLEQMLEAPLCERRAVEAIFQKDGQELDLWAITHLAQDVDASLYEPATYIWDNNDYTYSAPNAVSIPTPTPFVPQYTDAPNQVQALFMAVENADGSLYRSDYAKALATIDAALATVQPDDNAVIVDGLRYFRALTLEDLKRPDEALADYVAIYEAAPESAWGKLARLHLECVSGCG